MSRYVYILQYKHLLLTGIDLKVVFALVENENPLLKQNKYVMHGCTCCLELHMQLIELNNQIDCAVANCLPIVFVIRNQGSFSWGYKIGT